MEKQKTNNAIRHNKIQNNHTSTKNKQRTINYDNKRKNKIKKL